MVRSGVLALLLFAVTGCPPAGGVRVLHESDSAYNHLLVVDEGQGVRALFFEQGGAVQSRVDLRNPLALHLDYTRVAMLAFAAVPQPGRALVVGLGGGTMPRFLLAVRPALRVDAVELDPAVVDVARRFFDLSDARRLRVHTGDGRAFVEAAAPGTWDLVFLDAYGPSEIPRHLATVEFLTSLRGKLRPGGVVAANVWERGINPSYDAMVATWREAFPQLCVVPVVGVGNELFFASVDADLSAGALAEGASALYREAFPLPLPAYARVACADAQGRGAAALRD